MQVSPENPLAVTIVEAAAIAGMSTSWVRSKRDFGPLAGMSIHGRQGIRLDSLYALLRQRAPVKRPPPKLILVVDNT